MSECQFRKDYDAGCFSAFMGVVSALGLLAAFAAFVQAADAKAAARENGLCLERIAKHLGIEPPPLKADDAKGESKR